MANSERPLANWILAALPADARDAILARAVRSSMHLGDLVAAPNQPIEQAYFPESGCISLAAKIAEGQTVEMATVGWEGFYSPGFMLGVDHSAGESLVQVPGEAWVLPRRDFFDIIDQFPDARRLMNRYANAWMNQLGLHGACNAVHSVDERLARWILMTHDRMPSPELPLTHEFLAIMLGVRRASVSVAAGTLREAGLIDYTRGRVRVVDRERLELASCSCYRSIRASYDEIGIPRLVDHRRPDTPRD